MFSVKFRPNTRCRASTTLYWMAILAVSFGCASPAGLDDRPITADASTSTDGVITDIQVMATLDLGHRDLGQRDLGLDGSVSDLGMISDAERTGDADSTAESDVDLCPPIDQRPEPTLVDRFEDGSPEVEVRSGPFVVLAPEGHEPLAQHALDVLPGCHAVIRSHMGYCHPWREAIVHYGRFEPSRAKAENGVVYIGLSEMSLARLDQANVWRGEPAICGGQTTLAHEIVHTFQPAALPAWLKEGWADYFGQILVGGKTYECGPTSVCVRPPNTGGRPQPDACPNPIEYWDLSDPDWGVRPDPDDDRERAPNAESNKGRYYKTGTCFWQTIRDTYGADAIQMIFRDMYLNPREDLPIFPFSSETNERLMRIYFEPVLGPEVWALVEPYGIRQLQP